MSSTYLSILFIYLKKWLLSISKIYNVALIQESLETPALIAYTAPAFLSCTYWHLPYCDTSRLHMCASIILLTILSFTFWHLSYTFSLVCQTLVKLELPPYCCKPFNDLLHISYPSLISLLKSYLPLLSCRY